MNRSVPLDPVLTRNRRVPWATLIGALTVIGVGILLGLQYTEPDKRMIAVLAALVVFGMAWRIDMLTGVGLLMLLLPYPRGTVFGNTNFAMLLLLLVIWLLRVTLRQSPPPTRTLLDAPIAGLLIAFVISFYNLHHTHEIQMALQTMLLVISGMLLFYLLVSNVRTERDLERLHNFQAFSLLTIYLLALFELTHPGGVFIPGWIEFPYTAGAQITRNLRVGGPFQDYELLSEFSAIGLLLVMFLFVRARSVLRRATMGALMVLNLFVLFATVTRGAMVSLFLGVLYLVWLVRRRLQFVTLVILTVVAVSSFAMMNFYVAHFTYSGDLFARLQGTEIKGLVPDSRVEAWRDGWERFLIHPIIGWGPVYVGQTGTRLWFWPHNGYLLLANMVGIVGITFFAWMLWKLWTMTRPTVDILWHPSYARSFMLIAHVQLVVFMIDQTKIDFMRNPIYEFQVWLMFAMITAAARVARDSQARAALTSG